MENATFKSKYRSARYANRKGHHLSCLEAGSEEAWSQATAPGDCWIIARARVSGSRGTRHHSYGIRRTGNPSGIRMPAYPTAESPKRPRRNPERLCCVAVRVNPGATLPRVLLSPLLVKRGDLDRA